MNGIDASGTQIKHLKFYSYRSYIDIPINKIRLLFFKLLIT
jgi:hypothetical protein